MITQGILFALDIGTTKVCALVGEVREGQLQVIGLGIEPSRGMKKGMVVDVTEASVAIAKAVEKAEQSSGYELRHALVSMAGAHLDSCNNTAAISVNRKAVGITRDDINRALEAASAVVLPEGREVVHLVPRRFTIDDQQGILNPLGMYGSRMEVEAHIVTASAAALRNLEICTRKIGVETEEFVLNTLASAEAVLEPTEREMGVLVADIGGGTTDVALYTQGSAWHNVVIPLGGWHFTNDIAVGLGLPYDAAEEIKLRHGNCKPDDIDPGNVFLVKPFSGEQIEVGLQDLAFVLEARAEELCELILASIRDSGYNGLLPAGIVLTGGGAQLRNLTTVAERVLGVPARVAIPRNLVGLVEKLQSPAYATGVGLLRWAMSGQNAYRLKEHKESSKSAGFGWRKLLDAILPR
jgi:cell division protein FtsA